MDGVEVMLISIIIVLFVLLAISLVINAVQFGINLWYDKRHDKIFLKRAKWDARYKMLLKKYRVIESQPRITRTSSNALSVSKLPPDFESGAVLILDRPPKIWTPITTKFPKP